MNEVAWAAGLFEGEGCFTVGGVKDGRCQLIASLEMVDEETVRRFAAVVGVGNVRRKRTRSERWQDVWLWRVGSSADFRHVVGLLGPWLGSRRLDRAAELIDRHDTYLASLGRTA